MNGYLIHSWILFQSFASFAVHTDNLQLLTFWAELYSIKNFIIYYQTPECKTMHTVWCHAVRHCINLYPRCCTILHHTSLYIVFFITLINMTYIIIWMDGWMMMIDGQTLQYCVMHNVTCIKYIFSKVITHMFMQVHTVMNV